PLFAEASDVPQEITLKELIQNGYGTNRHVQVKDFRLCGESVVEKENTIRDLQLKCVWIPLVIDEDKAGKKREVAPVPRRPRVVAYYCNIPAPRIPELIRFRGQLQDPDVRVRQDREDKGYQGMVINGIKGLSPKVQKGLGTLAPDTDFAELI